MCSEGCPFERQDGTCKGRVRPTTSMIPFCMTDEDKIKLFNDDLVDVSVMDEDYEDTTH